METNFHNPNDGIEERLWGFIDDAVSSEEKTVIEKLLQTDAAWKAKYSELLELNKLLRSSELEAPSMRFSKNVMEEISKLHIAPATKSYINKRIIVGLAFFFFALIAGFLIYGFGQVDWTVGESNSTITDTLKKIDYSKFFNNTWLNVLMMINLVLGLFLFDAYLSNKRKEYRKEA